MEQKKENQTQEESNKQQLIQSKPLDFYYPENNKEKQINDSDLPSNLVNYFSIIGQDFSRRYNYHFFNEKEMLIANANTFQIINIETYDRRIIHSTEIGGIGAVVVHPEKQFFAVAENGEFPNIYIFEYPSLKLYRILRKGSEKGYSALNFNSRGDMLASVGNDPDYNLIIWNWLNESIILKAKAFSQEIFNVQFSQNIEGKLITSGIGHIRFWEMASTFTGLKLQGELGKFGQIDLSDISAFVEFPDGKVLSGTEYGTFLLWEGIFIKAHLMIVEKNYCHEGLIEYMSWDTLSTNFIDHFKEKYTEEATAKIRQENRNTDDYFEIQQINERINDLISKIEIPEKILCILTGGFDGYLRWWIFTDIENANIDDNSVAYIKPAVEKLLINPITNLPVKIINLVKENNSWIIQDANGYLLKLNFVYETIKNEKANNLDGDSITKEADFNFKIEVIYNFNSGSIIKSKQLCPSPYLLIQGSDSNTFLYNLNAKNFLGEKILLESNNDIKSTSCDIAQRESESDSLVMAIGYDIGLLRIYQFDNENLKLNLLTQLKAHEEPIRKVLFSPDKSYIITQTNTEIFIFIIDDYNKIIPFCSIRKNYNIIDLDWHPESKKFIIGLSDGSVEEIEIPLNFDNSKSFLMTDYLYKKFIVKLAENQLEKDEEKSSRRKNEQKKKKEPAPSSIISCKYINMYKEGDFLITAQKPFNEFLYLCNFDNEYFVDNEEFPHSTPRPIMFWKLPKPMDYSIKFISKNYIALCNNKGYVQIRNKNLLDKYVEIFPNSYSSVVTDISISEDEKLVSVSYKDGTVINYVLNHEGYSELIQLLKVDPYNTDPLKVDVKKGEEPAFEKLDNAIEVLRAIKKNEYEIDGDLVEKKRREDLEQMISLEKQKKDAEEREKLKKAEETKNQTRQKIKKLRDEFNKVITQNSGLNEEVRLTEEELVVDDNYLEHVKNNHLENLDDVKHKYDWLKANIHVTIDKIKSFFLDSVQTTKIYVFALKTNDFVNTLRCPNLPIDFKARLNYLNSEIAELQRRIDFDVLENEYKKFMPNDDEKKDNVQDTENILNKIRVRIQEYYDTEKESEGAVKSGEMNKNSIKQELEYTNENYLDLVKIIDDKKHVKNKIVQFNNDQKERNKKDKLRGKGTQNFSNKNSLRVKNKFIKLNLIILVS